MSTAAYMKARVADRRLRGLCARCGTPSGERFYCPTHSASNVRNVRRWRRKGGGLPLKGRRNVTLTTSGD